MDFVVPPELEELILCCYCRSPFNDTDALPKLFSCRHHFCLKCVNKMLVKNGEKSVYCIHCWKSTDIPEAKPENLPTYTAILYLTQNYNVLNIKSKPPDKIGGNGSAGGGVSGLSTSTASSLSAAVGSAVNNNNNNTKMKKGENCLTHAMPNALWCYKCHTLVCRACAASDEHRTHSVKTQAEAKESIRNDITSELLTMQKTYTELQQLALKQQDFLLKILEACTALKTQIETELISHVPTLEIQELRESLGRAKVCLGFVEQQTPNEAYKLYTTLHCEKQRLLAKHQDMYLQCKLDDLIRNYGNLFDFDLIKQALANLHAGETYNALSNGVGHFNPVLLLANYCISQLYTRHFLSTKHAAQILNNGNMNNYAQVAAGGLGGGGAGGSGGSGGGASSSAQQSQVLTPSPHHDSVVNKTFAELTSSPKNNNQTNNFSHLSDGGLMVAGPPPTTSQSVQPPHPSQQGQSGQQQQRPTNHQSYVQEMNRMAAAVASVPISMMQHLQQHSAPGQSLIQSPQPSSTLMCNPSVHVYPTYYFNIEINGQPCGRILIEVRNDVAPKMAKNFGALATNEYGLGYKGCQIFQCWENESIITGDFELNNGRGGRSIFEEGFFMPDDTKILAIRGSVGMRRSQKRHDNMGLVGSQFRIILREMRGFTGIFAFVVEGLDLVEKISQAGDSAGKPQSNVVIADCGKLQ